MRSAGRCWRVIVLVLGWNLALGLMVALPLAQQIENDLGSSEAALRMRDGFDYPWWSAFEQRQSGSFKTYAPNILGFGFAVRNLDLLLGGRLFGRLLLPGTIELAEPAADPSAPQPLDPLLTGLGVLYLVTQTFLYGGILTCLAGTPSRRSLASFASACGRFFGPCLRLALVAGVAYLMIFTLNRWLGPWIDQQALEASSGRAAHAWVFGRLGALLLAIALVHLTAGYARVGLVVGGRRSAVIAFGAALRCCLRRPALTLGHYLSVVLVSGIVLILYVLADGGFEARGLLGLLWVFVLAQAWMAIRIGLRFALAGGQIQISRAMHLSRTPP